MSLENKRVLMIIAFENFRDQEYFVPKEIFEEQGITVKTASVQTGSAIGADGGEAKIDFLLSEVDVNDFDVVLFVGGPGALQDLDSEDSYRIATQTRDAGKILAAICVAPVILAKAGALDGRQATVWSNPLDKSSVRVLSNNGVSYMPQPVVVDANIITADGPDVAEEFAREIVSALTL